MGYLKKKIIWILAIVLVFSAFWTFDYYHSKSFHLEYIEVTEQPSPADGETELDFIIRLTRNGKPVPGHDLFGIVYGRGGFKARRVRTDENGEAKFTYLPFVAHSESEIRDIPFKIMDESNSLFIEVNASYEGVLLLKMPEKEETGANITLDDIFGVSKSDE